MPLTKCQRRRTNWNRDESIARKRRGEALTRHTMEYSCSAITKPTKWIRMKHTTNETVGRLKHACFVVCDHVFTVWISAAILYSFLGFGDRQWTGKISIDIWQFTSLMIWRMLGSNKFVWFFFFLRFNCEMTNSLRPIWFEFYDHKRVFVTWIGRHLCWCVCAETPKPVSSARSTTLNCYRSVADKRGMKCVQYRTMVFIRSLKNARMDARTHTLAEPRQIRFNSIQKMNCEFFLVLSLCQMWVSIEFISQKKLVSISMKNVFFFLRSILASFRSFLVVWIGIPVSSFSMLRFAWNTISFVCCWLLLFCGWI